MSDTYPTLKLIAHALTYLQCFCDEVDLTTPRIQREAVRYSEQCMGMDPDAATHRIKLSVAVNCQEWGKCDD